MDHDGVVQVVRVVVAALLFVTRRRYPNSHVALLRENSAIYRSDLSGVPNAQLILHARHARDLHGELVARGIPGIRKHAQAATGAAERRELVREREPKIMLHPDGHA